jgi:hypothetical protein
MFYKGKQRHNPHINARPLTPEQVERALGGSVLVKPKPPISAGAIEAQQIIEKAKQLKGEAMPDINTALRTALENSKRETLHKTLDAWEQDEKETQLEKPMIAGKTNLFEVTTNVSRETFNFVRDNPGCNMAQIKQAMGAKGYNIGSVGSLLTQFVFQKHIHRGVDGSHTIISKEYTPLMSRAKWEKIHGITNTDKRKERMKKKLQQVIAAKQKQDAKAAGISALTVQEKKFQDEYAESARQHANSILLTRNWTAQGVVDKLTVMQARQLYDLLKQIFGG